MAFFIYFGDNRTANFKSKVIMPNTIMKRLPFISCGLGNEDGEALAKLLIVLHAISWLI